MNLKLNCQSSDASANDLCYHSDQHHNPWALTTTTHNQYQQYYSPMHCHAQINCKTYNSRNLLAKIPPVRTPNRWKNCVTAINIVFEQTKSNSVTSELNGELCSNCWHGALVSLCSRQKSTSRDCFWLALWTLHSDSDSFAPGKLAAISVGARQKNSPFRGVGAVNMMQAINQADGILHKYIKSTARNCHRPQLPITWLITSVSCIALLRLLSNRWRTETHLSRTYWFESFNSEYSCRKPPHIMLIKSEPYSIWTVWFSLGIGIHTTQLNIISWHVSDHFQMIK